MRIKTIGRKITPEPGVELAGYGPHVVSVGIHDDLYISGMLFDDGINRAIMFSYDLIGMDADIIRRIRGACSERTGIPAGNIILTCTHTHSGPHTRTIAGITANSEYVEFLVGESVAASSELFAGDLTEVAVLQYSTVCREGINRRVPLPDGSSLALPAHMHLEPLATGITDDELGLLVFVAQDTNDPAAVIANYAAHPLSCHSIGIASNLITSDYPGVIRDKVMESMGVPCVFTSGACGDIHPRGFETGFERTREMGSSIANKLMHSCCDAQRNPAKYQVKNPLIGTGSSLVECKLRETSEEISLELQFLAIGDVCFVGTPGEILVEPGLEIKWHSPFRKTFILYNSTAYVSYICHAHAFVGGGYEPDTSQLEPLAALKMVNVAVDELFKLKASMP